MIVSFLSCKDYTPVFEMELSFWIVKERFIDLHKICRKLEKERNDGFAIIACNSDKIIADATSWNNEIEQESSPFDAATRIGMYDYD